MEEDAIHVVRDPAGTRTLSLSNTDSKIISGSIAFMMWKCLKECICEFQYGPKGTQITNAIFRFETGVLATAFSFYTGAGAALMDYSNAFPSLKRSFLKRVLRKLHVPPCIIKCIFNLMQHCKRFLYPHLFLDFTIMVAEGLKQGCPLAALLFSLALSPFVRALASVSSAPCPALTSSYLDDMAMVLPDLRNLLPKIIQLYN